jgi:hypothetical protein
MPEFSAMELEAREVSPVISTRLIDHVLRFLTGALFSAALVAGGAVLVLVALTVGVVGSPVIAMALGWWVLRRREATPRALRAA